MTEESPQQRYNRSHPEAIKKSESNRQASYKTVSVRFHKVDDAKLIQWLESQGGSLQDAIKTTLYAEHQRNIQAHSTGKTNSASSAQGKPSINPSFSISSCSLADFAPSAPVLPSVDAYSIVYSLSTVTRLIP